MIAKAPNGKEVKEKSVYQGNVLAQGSTTRRWVDEDGKVFNKSALSFECGGEEVSEIEQTKVFEIEGYQALQNYTDKYICQIHRTIG